MGKIKLRLWTVPLALFALTALSYGTELAKLGFYWDDWTAVWYTHFLGTSSFKAAYAVDRPLLGSIITLTTGLLGESALNWQIFALFTRWLTSLVLWWSLKLLWPKQDVQVAAIALLFTVYPGFNQQFIAFTYSNGFILYSIFLASLGSMVWALRRPERFWPIYLSSLALSGFALFSAEYFFGLELVRPALIWLVLSESVQDTRRRFQRTARYWAPYLALALLFVVWRGSTETPRAQLTIFERLAAGPVAATFELGKTALLDIIEATALAWRQTINIPAILAYEPMTILKYAVIALGAGVLTTFFLVSLSSTAETGATPQPVSRRRWALQATLLGALALFLGGLPIWVTNLRMELFFPWDRFTLPMMWGASILLVGLIELVTRIRWQSAILVGAAVGIAAGMHFQSALTYRKEWLAVRDFFWQLTWRAPGIQPGTILLTSELPFLYDWDNSLTSPLNWIYAPDNTKREFPYLLYNVESRLSSGLPRLEENTRVQELHRVVPFNGSPSQAVLVFYQPPGCVKVIDPSIDLRLPDKPLFFRDVVQFSDPTLIMPTADPPAQPPAQIFGAEPEHGWCYYFEKAELARQQGDWEAVAELGDQAMSEGKRFYRKNVAELVPFIQGYAHVGRWERAVELSQEAYETWENMRLMLCDVWEELNRSGTVGDAGEAAHTKMMQNLQCSAP